ncbi:hypothetical protein OTU49_002098, partial [Cherax quadricarinatus]
YLPPAGGCRPEGPGPLAASTWARPMPRPPPNTAARGSPTLPSGAAHFTHHQHHTYNTHTTPQLYLRVAARPSVPHNCDYFRSIGTNTEPISLTTHSSSALINSIYGQICSYATSSLRVAVSEVNCGLWLPH